MKKIILFILLTVSTNVFANDTYLCIADKATGFSFNKRSETYESTDFNIDKSKYILKKNNNTWEWKIFGIDVPLCNGSISANGYFRCDWLETIIFNKNNLRYTKAHIFGYVNVGSKTYSGFEMKDGQETPYMEIGKCSPM